MYTLVHLTLLQNVIKQKGYVLILFTKYFINDINKQVKLKNVCILLMCVCTYCATQSKRRLGFHDTISNDFIDITFLWPYAAKLQLSEHTCVTIFFLR